MSSEIAPELLVSTQTVQNAEVYTYRVHRVYIR